MRVVVGLRAQMRDLGHTRLDILKIDIDGGEYQVFEQLRDTGFFPTDQVRCVIPLDPKLIWCQCSFCWKCIGRALLKR
jgi:hypothetical protein